MDKSLPAAGASPLPGARDTRKLEAVSASIVKFEYCYSEGDEKKFSVVVPASLLWSGDGLKYLFEAVRSAYFVNPGQDGFDGDVWESFHLVSAKEHTDFFLITMPGEPLAPVGGLADAEQKHV